MATKTVGQFKVARVLTKTLFKQEKDQQYFFLITSPILQGKKMTWDKMTEADNKREPAYLCDVIDLETGEEGQIICSHIQRTTLQTEYPNDGYIGRAFAMETSRDPKKDYNHCNVIEIEANEAQVEAAPEAPVTQIKSAKGRK